MHDMNGLATINALKELTQSDDSYAFLHGRASDAIRPAPGSERPPFDFGTPGAAELRRAERREKLYGRVFKIAIWAVLLSAFYIAGLNAKPQREPVNTSIEYHVKAQRLAAGTRRHELDLHERCMVFMHKDIAGQPSVSWHC